ncbi:MAG: glycosyltransferase [bacterium]|nr:glycosyltransferase [bacterium]
MLNLLILRFAASKKIEQLIGNDIGNNSVFYSYWFMQWTFSLSILKLKYPKLKLVSRTHGADYDENQIQTTLPFRYFQLSKVNKVFPVSQYGADYLQREFRFPKEKISVSRLGLVGQNALSPVDSTTLHIVSCSSLIPLKRVGLIIEILNQMHIDVKWTHFGDGPLLEELVQKSKRLTDGCIVNFKGNVPNREFLSFMATTAVSIFINVSESEGLPVSLMEAISFGVPVMGTSICGVPEIVTKQTGFLIDKNFDPTEIAILIVKNHNNGALYLINFRNAIQNFYYEFFYAPKNHVFLAKQLLQISQN